MSVLEHFAASVGENGEKQNDNNWSTEAQNMNPFFDCWDCMEIANKAACTGSFYVQWKRPNDLMLLACECSAGDPWYFNLK